MSTEGVDAAVRLIFTDRSLAQSVAEEGAPALTAFALTEAEQAAIVDAVRRDFQAASEEVEGFGIHILRPIPLTNLMDVASPKLFDTIGPDGTRWENAQWGGGVGDDTPT